MMALTILLLGLVSAQAQTTLSWRSEAANGNWDESINWWNGSGTQAPAGSEILQFDNGAQLTMNNNLSGSATNRYRILFQSGSGARTISGTTANTFYDFGGSAPKIENNSANQQTLGFPIAIGASHLEINPVNADLSIQANVNLNGNQLRIYGNNGKQLSFTAASVISGTSGSVSLNENSKVIFQNAHTYTGDTYINAGTLQFNSGGSANSSTLRLGDISGSAAATLALASGVNLGSTLVVRSGSSGAKTIGSTASSSTATLSGSVYLDADVTATNRAGTLVFSGTEFDLKNQTLTLVAKGSGEIQISALLKNTTGTGKLVKEGTELLTLAGNNTFSGGVEFNAGQLKFTHKNGAGSGTITVNSGATDFLSGALNLVLPNAIILNSGAFPLYYANSGFSIDQTGVISGGGGITRDNTGAGTVQLSGANSFTGGVILKSRDLRLNHKQCLGLGTFTLGDPSVAPATAITLVANTALTGANAVTNAVAWNQDFGLTSVQSLELSGPVSVAAATRTVTVNGGVTLTFSGPMTGGAGGITKAGNGTLSIAGPNACTGNTTISAGILSLGAAGSISNSPAINVASGATFNVSAVSGFAVQPSQTLKGGGTVVGPMAVNGTIAPGASVGTLTTAGEIWKGGGAFQWEMNDATGTAGSSPGWDKINGGSSALDVQATSGSKFTIQLTSLNGSGAGQAANFNPDSNYAWPLASFGSVTGFDTNKFAFDSSAFQNDLRGGVFSLTNDSSDGTLKVRFLANRSPAAGNTNVVLAPGLTWKISIADLLTNLTTDADADARVLHAIGAASHGTVSTNASFIFYTPTDTASDSFTYTVRDLRSYRVGDTFRTAQGTISITKAAAGGLARSITASGGAVTIQFFGIPGRSYDLQRADSVDGPFATLEAAGTQTASAATGAFQFSDTPGTGTFFYRSIQH